MNLTISMDTVLNFLHSMALSTSNKRWLADHLYEEVRAEQKTASAVKVKKKLTEKEKDELFYSVAGAWKDGCQMRTFANFRWEVWGKEVFNDLFVWIICLFVSTPIKLNVKWTDLIKSIR